MNTYFKTDTEIAKILGERIRNYRVSESGASMTRDTLAAKADVSLSSLERLEGGGNSRLLTLISVLRELGLLDNFLELVPDISEPTPMDLLEHKKPNRVRAYASRKKRGDHE